MGPAFDPYHKWLGIPPQDQPPDHYRLLGIQQFESDLDVIQSAADQRMAHLRNYQTGPHSNLSQRLLNEVAVARLCLLKATKKAAYDEQLRLKLQEKLEEAQEEYPLATPMAPEVDLLDGLPYGSVHGSVRKRSAGWKSRLPIAAVIGAASAVAVLSVGLYWNGNIGSHDVSAVAVKPRNATVEGTARNPRQVDTAAEGKAKRNGPTAGKKAPADISQPSSEVAKPMQPAPPSPNEPPHVNPPAATDTESKSPPVTEGPSPEPSAPLSTLPSPESAEKKAETPPPADNVPPLSSSSAEPKAVERASARVRVRFNRWFDLLTPRNELADWDVGDCHYRYEGGIVEVDDGYMFCPIVVKDAMIRAVVRRSGSGAHVYLVLRESDEGCYAAGLEDHVVKILRLKRIADADNKQPLVLRRTFEKLGEFTILQVKGETPTAGFVFGFRAIGDTLTVYINFDFPLLAVKDKHFSEGAVGIGVQNNWAYFADVEMWIPNKAAFVADLRPLPTPPKSSGPGDSKVPPIKLDPSAEK